MPRPNRSSFAAWLRGGQTLSHTYDMALEVLGRLVIISALWGVLCFFSVNRFAGDKEQVYGILSLQADLLEWIGPPAPQELRFPDLAGREATHRVEAVRSLPWMRPYSEAYRARLRYGVLFFVVGILVIGMGSAAWFLEFGREKLRTRQVRGQRVERFTTLIADQGGTVEKVDHWGKRQFAYEIQHMNEGYYTVIDLQVSSEGLVELERQLRLTDEIVRHKVVRPGARTKRRAS